LKVFFHNLMKNEEKKWFTDGYFQFEATNQEKPWGQQNLHFQGCLKASDRVTKTLMISLVNSSFRSQSPYLIFSGSYIRPAVKDEYQSLKAYCMKRTSRIAGPWQVKAGKVYEGRDIIKRDQLWPWQREILGMIEQYKKDVDRDIFETRDVLFVVDRVGAAGKSSFCKFLSFHKLALVLGHGSPRDLMFEVINNAPSLAYLFDLTRSKPQDCTFGDTCSIIEELKNGVVRNLKYKVESRLQTPAFVVVFANFMPTCKQKSLLSIDRWVIIELTEDHIPPAVRARRKEDKKRKEALLKRFQGELKKHKSERVEDMHGHNLLSDEKEPPEMSGQEQDGNINRDNDGMEDNGEVLLDDVKEPLEDMEEYFSQPLEERNDSIEEAEAHLDAFDDLLSDFE